MKRNVFLRAAALLLLLTVCCSALLTGTLARYVSEAAGAVQAQAAKFSFVTGNRKYNGSGAWHAGSAADTAIDAGSAAAQDKTVFWRQVAISADTPTFFEVPMFDDLYYGVSPGYGIIAADGTYNKAAAANQNDLITVWSRPNALADRSKWTNHANRTVNRDLLAAPGTGYYYGDMVSNPNVLEASAQLNSRSVRMEFRNDSEVAVAFRISLDKSKSTLNGAPISIFNPHEPANIWCDLSTASQWPVLTWNDAARWNAAQTPAAAVDLFWADQAAWAANALGTAPEDEWMTLSPGEYYCFGFSWIWDGGTAARNAADSALGVAAANYLRAVDAGRPQAELDTLRAACTVSLAFKLEVVQVD